MSIWRSLLGLLPMAAGLSWDPLKPQSSVPHHGHRFGDLSIDTPSLVQLAESLGGGIYPGLGSGQNDHIANQDSVAPGFPIQLFWLEPGNVVKRQAVKLSIQPSAYRTPLSGNSGAGSAHGHAGDTVQTLSVSINNDSSSPTIAHFHNHQLRHGLAADETPGYDRANDLFTTSDTADHYSARLTDTDASHGGGAHYHTHAHTNTSHTHTPGTTGNESTHTHPVVSGFSNGTSPDNMGVMVDGIDVTSQLGGPWNAAQTELDVTPFVAPGTGFHLIQVTTATQVGRIYGFARLKSINNNLGPGRMIDAILKTPCPHGLDCADHDACCERQPHLEGHTFCMWCMHCRVCHEHDCYHLGDPCSRCGTYVKDRPKPTFGIFTGMCDPPA